LKRLHKPIATLGFGVPGGAPEKRRILVLVRCDVPVDDPVFGAIEEAADAVVIVPGLPGHEELVARLGARHSTLALGVWAVGARDLPAEAASPGCDFLVCDVDAPVEALPREGRGGIMVLSPDIEASRARAIAELGIDAVLPAPESIDLSRASSLVECRRLYAITGKPVVVCVREPLTEAQLVALWRGGVDALLVDASAGGDVLKSLRSSIAKARFGSRAGMGGAPAAIGAFVGAFGLPEVADADDGGDDEEPDDDD